MIGGRKNGIQSKRNVGRKKGKQSKSKKVTSQKPKEPTGQHKKFAVTRACKKRTELCNSYWLNGLRFSRKPNDERVMLFKEKKHITSEDFSGSRDCPKCCLCCGDEATSNYIACEICGGNHLSSVLFVFLPLCWGIGWKRKSYFMLQLTSSKIF